MSSREEAKRALEDAMRGQRNPIGDAAEEFFGGILKDAVLKAKHGRVYPKPKDEQCRAVGDIFAGLADEARAIRMRMEKAS